MVVVRHFFIMVVVSCKSDVMLFKTMLSCTTSCGVSSELTTALSFAKQIFLERSARVAVAGSGVAGSGVAVSAVVCLNVSMFQCLHYMRQPL